MLKEVGGSSKSNKAVSAMRICLVASIRLGLALWGVQKFTLVFSSWLREHGHDIVVVYRSLFGAKGREKPTTHDKRVLNVPHEVSVVGMLLFSLLAVIRILGLNKERRITVIHAQDTGYGGLAAVIAAKIVDVPVVISSHGLRYVTLLNSLTGPLKALELGLERVIDRLVCRSADAIIAVGKHVENYLKEDYDLLKGKTATFVVPVGIDVQRYSTNEQVRQEVRRELRFSNDQVIMGFVGRLWPEKNPLFLLEAFATIAKLVPQAKLLIVGGGPLKQEMGEFVKETGLNDKVVFAGVRKDVDRLLAAIDIFVLPSLTEGCPTALLEAMASGKTIIASRIPSIQEIVKDGADAVLIDPHNSEELKKAILLLYDSPDLRAKLGLNAKQKAQLYDADKLHEQILRIYDAMVHQVVQNDKQRHAREVTMMKAMRGIRSVSVSR